jgi:5-methylcytosine-specific restriction endonuclease McrA
LGSIIDTTHTGTLYKVNLPDEIQSCIEREKTQVAVETQTVDEKKELDYYNVAENRLKIFERDGFKCHYCQKQLTRFSATLDHIQPVSRGGDNSFDNLITSCLHCNSRRGNKPVMDIIMEKGNDS